MSLSEEIEQFRRIYATQREGYVTECERLLASIGDRHDPESIRVLCSLFDDEAEFDELMFSIIHTIETFDNQTYIRELLEVSPGFCNQSPRWASIVFMRVLNSDASRKQLLLKLRTAPVATKDAIRALMEKINQRSVQFLEKTTPVIVATN